MHVWRRQHRFHLLAQRLDTFSRERGDNIRVRHQRLDPLTRGLIHTIGLVECHNRGNRFHTIDVGKHVIDRVDL